MFEIISLKTVSTPLISADICSSWTNVTCIDQGTTELCDLALHKFVVQVPELHGDMSYNVHLMTHLAGSVEWWGPLWATSAFMFEDANGKLLMFFHSSRGVSKQM